MNSSNVDSIPHSVVLHHWQPYQRWYGSCVGFLASSTSSLAISFAVTFESSFILPYTQASAPLYLLSSVHCRWPGSAVHHDRNSLVSWILIWIFEVLLSDALPTTSNVDTTATSVKQVSPRLEPQTSAFRSNALDHLTTPPSAMTLE